jgi:hypothetical protein
MLDHSQRRWMALILGTLLLFGLMMARPARPQLQQSGGSGGSTNLTQVGGTAIALGQAAMASSLPVTIASNQSALSVSESGSWNVGLSSGTNLIGYTRPQNACGTTNYESVMSNPPTSSTSLTATTTCVSLIYVSNTTSSAATLTVQDQGTGCNSAACIWIDAFSVPSNSNMVIPLYGAKFASGIKWSQGTANALSVDIIGNQ